MPIKALNEITYPFPNFNGATVEVWEWVILTRPAVNIAVNKIDILRVRYHYSRYCVTIVWPLWRHQQSIVTSSAQRKPGERRRHGDDVSLSSFLSSFMDSLCRVRNKTMYVLSRRTISAHTRVLFWNLFPSLLRNPGNKHQNNPLMSTETVCHSSAYIILYVIPSDNIDGLVQYCGESRALEMGLLQSCTKPSICN